MIRGVIYSLNALMGESYEDDEFLNNPIKIKRRELPELREFIGPRKWRIRVLEEIRLQLKKEVLSGRARNEFPDIHKLIRLVLSKYSDKPVTEDLVEKILSVIDHLSQFQMNETTRAVLQTAYARNYVQGIIANTILPARYYSDHFTAMGFNHFFEAIICSADMQVPKPDPEIFQLALEALEFQPDELIFVADSLETDVIGGVQMGIKTILLNRYTTLPKVPKGVEIVQDFHQLMAKLPPL